MSLTPMISNRHIRKGNRYLKLVGKLRNVCRLQFHAFPRVYCALFMRDNIFKFIQFILHFNDLLVVTVKVSTVGGKQFIPAAF